MHPFCNLQSRARTHTVLVIGLYELLGNPTTQLIEPPGPLIEFEIALDYQILLKKKSTIFRLIMHVLCFVEVSSELTLQVKNDLENNILEKETCY